MTTNNPPITQAPVPPGTAPKPNRKTTRHLLALCATLILCLLPTLAHAQDKSGVQPQVISLPSGPGSLEGLGESFEPNLSTGTSSSPVKFTAAPGRVGFQPEISLNYNGGNPNGPWGMGWSLSVPSIQRRTDDGIPSYDDGADTFIFSGGEKLVRLTNGDYRFENESSFTRFRRLEASAPNGAANNNGWEAHTPDGIRYVYGESENARVTTPGGIFRWQLERVIDTHGNEMRYRYLHDGGYAYPSEIRYNFGPKEGDQDGNGQEVYNAVIFNYEPRPDTFTDRRSGAPLRIGLRGTNIEIWSMGTLVRAYAFQYEPERSTGTYSLLTHVTQVGDDGVSTLPPHTFTYTQFDAAAHAVVPMQNIPPVDLTNPDADLVDIDADGLPDLVHTPADGQHRFYLNRGHGRWATDPVIPANSPGERLSNPNVRMADMNGDGRTDLLVKASGAGNVPLYYYRNQPGADWEQEDRIDFGPAPSFDLNDPNLQLMDVNNDRRIDVVLSGGDRMKIWLARDGAWSQEADFDVPAPAAGESASFADPKFKVGDMTGDRMDDVVMVREGQVVLWEHNGNGSYEDPRPILNPPTDLGSDELFVQMGDLNNDGQMDLVLPGNRVVRYWLSLGNGSLTDPITIPNAPAFSAEDTAVRLADIDGDGATELLYSSIRGMEYMDFSTQEQPFLLRSVDNGRGRIIHITYKSSIEDYITDLDAGEPWQINLPFPVQVVNRVTVYDANSGDNYTINYHYRDGYYDGEEREFRGFVRSQEIKVGDETAATTVTNLLFDVGIEDEAHKGMLLESEVLAVDGTCSGDFSGCFQRTVNQLETREVVKASDTLSGEPVAYAFVNQSDTFIHEQQSEAVQLRQRFAQDDFGNQTEVLNYGQVCGADVTCGNDEILTFTDFIYDRERHIFNRPMHVRQTDAAGGFVSEMRIYYDGDPFTGLPLGQLTRGDATRQEVNLGPLEGNRFIDGQRTQFDQYGNAITMMDANGNTTSVEYDPIQHTFPVVERANMEEGRSLTYAAAYDHGLGKMTAATDYNGHAYRFAYDTFGHISKIAKPGDTLAQPTQQFFYQYGSPRTSIITEQRQRSGQEDVITSVSYFDGLGRKLQIRSEDVDGRVIVENAVEFNARQGVRRQYLPYYGESFDYAPPDADLPHTALHYDALGRTVRTVNPDGSFSTVQHRPLAEILFDEEDNRPDSAHHNTPTTHISDGLQRLIRVEEVTLDDGAPTTFVTRYGYDTAGNLARITDAQGNVKTMRYDALARVRTINDPDRGVSHFTYDHAGNLLRVDDALGRSLHYTYDAGNRPLSERWVYNNGRADVVNAIYHYDNDLAPEHPDARNTMGQISYVEDQTGAIYFSYDARGNAVGSIRHFDDEGVSLVTRSQFDTMGRLTQLTLADGFTVQYERNARGQLTRVPGFVEQVTYNASDQRESIRYANGVATSYDYDQRQRMDHLRSTSGQTVLQELRYTFDGTGNVLSISDSRPGRTDANDLSQRFTYDSLYRLVNATGTYGEIDFAYDAIGNMVRKTSTVADARLNLGEIRYGDNAGPHAPTAAGGVSYSYDANGNLLRKEGADAAETARYEWDARNRLMSADTATDTGATQSTYDYDAGYQRVRQMVRDESGVTTTLYGGSSVELRGDELVYYIFDDEQRIARITMPYQPERLLTGFSDAPGTVPPASVARDWFVSDYLGSTSLLVDEAGGVDSRMGYYPYGLSRYEEGEDRAYYQFTGKELDASGLHYFETRYYDAITGHFTGVDPYYHEHPEKGLANPQLLNLYSYGLNNPTKYNDPSGMSPEGQTQEEPPEQKVTQGVIDASAKALEDTSIGKGLGVLGNILSFGTNVNTLLDPKKSTMDKVEAGHGTVSAVAGAGETFSTVAGYGRAAAAFGATGTIATALTPMLMWAKGMTDAREGIIKHARANGRRAYAVGVSAGLLGLSYRETMERFGMEGSFLSEARMEMYKANNAALAAGWKKVAHYSDARRALAIERLVQKAERDGRNYFFGWNGDARNIEPIVWGYSHILREHYGEYVNK